MEEQQSQRLTRSAVEKLANAPEKSMLHPPTDAATVRLVDAALRSAGYQRLPVDYAFFLTLACGLQGPYCTLLGPGGLRTADGDIEPGIQRASERFNSSMDAGARQLVLGRASGNTLLVFAGDEYRLLDAQTRDVLRTYDGVAAFIEDMIAMKGSGRGQPVS